MLGQHRSTQRRTPTGRDDEERLTADIVELARRYGRYGYRKIAELLRRQAGWVVNDKRVERIWRREGPKVPEKQPKRGRQWLADGSRVRLRAERRNHVWSYDFVEDRTHEGRKYRMLNVIDEFTRECLAIRIDRRLRSNDAIDVLSDLFILRGIPEHIRSDNGPEFVAKAVREGLSANFVLHPNFRAFRAISDASGANTVMTLGTSPKRKPLPQRVVGQRSRAPAERLFGDALRRFAPTAATIAGTNDGSSQPPADLIRASRRQVNNCCGVSP